MASQKRIESKEDHVLARLFYTLDCKKREQQ
jgi:hypothetical protein